MRSYDELAAVADPAAPLLRSWLAQARNHAVALPASASCRDELVSLQVTLHSTLGAVVHETGGVLVDHGWVRLLGSGHPRLPRSIAAWNALRRASAPGGLPPYLLVADDVTGGFFALDGGARGTAGHVHYLAPDTLRWEDLDLGYTDLVEWLLAGDVAGFYADYRWDGWQEDVAALPGDHAYSIAPPPALQGPPYPQRSRRAVPVAELFELAQDLGRQLADVADGQEIQLKIE